MSVPKAESCRALHAQVALSAHSGHNERPEHALSDPRCPVGLLQIREEFFYVRYSHCSELCRSREDAETLQRQCRDNMQSSITAER
jgi:hypothetical protein